jgi:hypothetical protein
MSKITVFENISETKKPYYINIEHALQRIRNGAVKAKIEKIRKVKTKSLRDKEKMKLPSVCFSGTFKHRAKDGIINHSGFICLDFDHCNVEEKKEELKSSPYIFACWVSPSGDGVKALVRIPAKIDKHEMFFHGLQAMFKDVDPSGKDVSRVCYESYDKDIYINHTSTVFDKAVDENCYDYDTRPPVLPVTSDDEIFNNIIKWLEKRGDYFQPGNRNSFILKLAGALNRFGVSEYQAEMYCNRYKEKDFTDSEIKRTVASAYKNKSQHGVSYFENIEKRHEVRKKIKEGHNPFDIAKGLSESENIKETDAMKIVEDEKNRLHDKLEVFWTVQTNAKGVVTKIELNRRNFINFLHDNGFFRHRVSLDYIMFVNITDNIIREVSLSDIKNFVFDWIEKLEDDPFDGIDKFILFEFMAAGVKGYFGKELLDLIKIIDVQINRESPDTAYFYYINGAVMIQKNKINLVNYCDLEGKVWKNKIIDRHIVLNDTKADLDNNYTRFLNRITDSDEAYDSLCTVIGYLLHTYKDKKISKAVVFNDRQISDNPEGGSGKGLIMEGIRNIRNVVTFDGKKYTKDKAFLFQRVEVDTDIIFFDDLQKNFDFEGLFSIITEGLPVEKKNKAEFYIDFYNSPKIALATNYYIKGDGSSNDRRKIDVEINNYFSARYTPFDEFKETLFADWSNEVWNDFDNFMIRCCHFYLTSGLKECVSESIKDKKFLVNTCHEFVEFSESIPLNQEINRKDLLNKFAEQYANYKNISIKKLMQFMESYAKYAGLTFHKDYRRSGNDFFVALQSGTSEIQKHDSLFDF